MAKKLLEIGPLEMEVLGCVNAGGEHSVNDIQVAMDRAGRELAYTTVMTVLVRLYNKGLVQRRKESRYFLYSAAKKRESHSSTIFEKVRNSLFGAERLKPILGLIENEEDLSRAELEELKRAVEARLKNHKGPKGQER
jgi:predicted transcriptional regulator